MSDENSPIEAPIATGNGKLAYLGEVVRFALMVAVVLLPVRLFIAKPFIVSGESMHPTFESGDYLVIDEITYKFNEPKRGEVVVFKYPNDLSKYFIKRIIGLPKETVTIEDGRVEITSPDSKAKIILNEPYIADITRNNTTKTLKDDEFFVMGDNRPASLDSRSWGAMPRTDLVGRALLRLYPLNKIGLHPGYFNP
jgi:signal peptidase I